MKTIPKKYMWRGSYENGGYRKLSPIGQELQNKTLEEIECPCCGHKDLELLDYGDDLYSEYQVECYNCYWQPHTERLSDYGEAVCPFKEWLEAWYLLGRPKTRIGEDLRLEFYPDEEWREAVRNYWSKENMI